MKEIYKINTMQQEQRYEATIKVNVWAKDKADAILQSQRLAELLKAIELDNRAHVHMVKTAFFGVLKEGEIIF